MFGPNIERQRSCFTSKRFNFPAECSQVLELAAGYDQVGTGARAEKIRTYNFPENRVTDHRIKLTTHRLDQILQGDLDEYTDALTSEQQRRALEG